MDFGPSRHQSNLFIADEMMQHIFSFLDYEDALSFRSTCKDIKRHLNVHTFNLQNFQHLSREHHWKATYNDREKVWFSLTPLISELQRIPHTIIFDCEWKDQGWGNRKGTILIREQTKNDTHYPSNDKEAIYPDPHAPIVGRGRGRDNNPLAEHHWTKLRLVFRPAPGKNYIMCRYIGAHGGQLIRNPRFCVVECNKLYQTITTNTNTNISETNLRSSDLALISPRIQDALSYLDQVKLEFGNNNKETYYDEFVNILKKRKENEIDTTEVARRVSVLFHGNEVLLNGLSRFLPVESPCMDELVIQGCTNSRLIETSNRRTSKRRKR
mmetsp:Transcript_23861/g.27624  ORF Transcript_23861/g.27624 Transcript_23861/m.27624 type:complete len:326 (-) Transcript_23861:132-1109(-)